MTLTQLQYFCEIAQRENYRAASEALHVAQPSLSRSMAQLEEELNVSLFSRSGRGVKLTKAGRMFLEQARNILASCNAASRQMEEFARGGGNIDIGYIFPLAGRFIPKTVREFLEQPGNEHVTFHFWQNHTPAVLQQIHKGELDVGFGGCVEKTDLEHAPILSQELMIITPENHPLADQEEISLEEFATHPVIGYDRGSWMGIHTRALFKKFGIQPDIIVECPDEYSILSLVREGFGIALVPRTDLFDDMDGYRSHTIEGHHLAHQIFMFWNRDQEHLPSVDRFIQFVLKKAAATDSMDESKTYLRDIIQIEV